ncbi:hypothetical protein ES703_13594 [subsurface metagenome]
MPQFAPGEARIAIAPIRVAPSGLSCQAEIFLGPDEMTKVATSGSIPFTSIGVSQDVHLPVTMPDAEGTYHVFIDIYAEGLLIGAYKATEDVVIATLVGFTMGVVMLPGNVTHWRALMRSRTIPPGFEGYPGTLPEVDSGYLDPAERWRCPVDPWMDSFSRTLMVWGLQWMWDEDAGRWDYETVTNIIQLYGLHSGRDYTYNFVTHVLDGGVGDETLWWGYP